MSEEAERLAKRLAQATAELESVQSAAADAERQMSAFASSAHSADGSVEVSVGGQGEVTEVRFLDGKYRSMTASQLSEAVLSTIQEARSHHSRMVRDLFEPLTRPSAVMPELPGLELDWDRIVGPAADSLPEDSLPRTANDRLRDEIEGDEP
ncbi:YbaB/EbfC family nucleoid-associated protein (plasmid) [Streptomyces scopuliridis]|uniref:YbaB/EbfC family nucleoid-associated protein n=1 Tax=Streptomyces scopuliridis TaxID=452529 RepID=A0ACD4ZZF0_9ACTN|nr:YbaB/EbfC family nucleoid-associated protein [Streptomyces scopuliridis]WSC03497.1 YbaB/EbfC family nucleoid-associated protein [Streptomyces scopuliridis]WSC11358.1 YbaB/EbfC family nucleoid-associated protein [Streptomyces scopuliridis]